ncbi:hypothetical protein, partial [Methylogaea oryzae]|uniref:hypothetical protein n=1 Tax=Methylogaea oryzae TaxID=1295382 RepID=UPI001C3F1714
RSASPLPAGDAGSPGTGGRRRRLLLLPRAIYYSPALQQRQTRTTESGNVDVRIGIGHSAPALGNAPRNTGNATPSITPGPSR